LLKPLPQLPVQPSRWIRFERDAGGSVVRLVGLYPDVTEEPNLRGGE